MPPIRARCVIVLVLGPLVTGSSACSPRLSTGDSAADADTGTYTAFDDGTDVLRDGAALPDTARIPDGATPTDGAPNDRVVPSDATTPDAGRGPIVAVSAWPVPVVSGSPFGSSSRDLADGSNVYWRTYTVAEGPTDRNGTRFADNEAWAEWDAMKFAWSEHGGYRAHAMDVVRTLRINGFDGVTGTQPAGYVWSWGDRETWPDQDAANHHGVGSLHFDQQPRFINAVFTLVAWTRDMAYLAALLPRAEATMTYMLDTMRGRVDGVIAAPGAANNGTAGARASTYMDEVGSGYQDGWTNAAFYASLRNLAQLEAMAGNTARRDEYGALATAFSAHFDSALWNPATQRYAGWRDARGALHDAGYTYVNLEALARGLGNTDRASHVFDWLAAPAQPTEAGAHVGSTDVYQYVAAPRSNTSVVPATEWDGWSDAPSGRTPYGFIVENGAAMLWTNYYDVMARLRYADADAAFQRYIAMLNRMSQDSHLLAYNPPSRLYNDFGEGIGELGSSTPFPESGISVVPFLTGFIGAEPTSAGLVITPNLPFDMLDAQASNVSFVRRDRTLFVSRGYTVVDADAANGVERLGAGDTLEQRFTASAVFNEVAAFVGTYATSTSAFTVAVERMDGTGAWIRIASRQRAGVPDNSWRHIALPEQPAGASYRILMSEVVGSIAWYRNDGGSIAGGRAFRNGSPLATVFRFRAVMAPQAVVVDQRASDTPDHLSVSLGQTFTSPDAFDRVSIQVGTYTGTNSGFTATLFQDVGGRWARKQEQVFRSVPDNSEIVIAFATQSPGKYLLELTSPINGIAWYRSSADVYPGAGLYALTDGNPVAGDRWFRVFRGGYRLHIPENAVDLVLDAGANYVLAR